MRIVLISEIFSKGMGYLENVLPKYLARLGAEVDVMATSLPPNYRQDPKQSTYRGFANSEAPGTVATLDGFRLHVLAHKQELGHIRLAGVREKLNQLRPDIVQIMTPIGWIAIDSALARLRLGFRLFSGCHYHASVFPLAQRNLAWFAPARLRCSIERGLHGRAVSWCTEKCYAISADCAEVAARFFGVPRQKLAISPLGVESEVFHASSGQDEAGTRKELRLHLGFQEEDIVCIYTGRFTDDKNPLLLAQAVARLHESGENFRGLFVGNGPQAGPIARMPGCVAHPFVPMNKLGDLYRAAELAVWPTQESMSMLDAAACGLPVIANDRMGAPERLQGCGRHYRLGNLDDLTEKIRLLKSAEVRRRLGAQGARRMKEEYSWEAIAERRLADYAEAMAQARILGSSGTVAPAPISKAQGGTVSNSE